MTECVCAGMCMCVLPDACVYVCVVCVCAAMCVCVLPYVCVCGVCVCFVCRRRPIHDFLVVSFPSSFLSLVVALLFWLATRHPRCFLCVLYVCVCLCVCVYVCVFLSSFVSLVVALLFRLATRHPGADARAV